MSMVFGGVSTAFADDDGGGDDDGGSSGSSAGSSGSSRERGSSRSGILQLFKQKKASRGKRPRKPARASARPQFEPAQLVAMGLDAGALTTLAAQGFVLVDRAALAAFGGEVVKLDIPGALTIEQARQRAAALAPAASVDFNHYYRVEEEGCSGRHCPIRTLIGWPTTGAQASSCGEEVVIGLVDTAINPDHEAFEGGSIEVIRLSDEKLPESGKQHGTAVAALLVGQPGSRSPGLLPAGTLIAVDAFHQGAGKDDRSEAFDLVRAMDLLALRGVAAINMSFAGPDNALLKAAVEQIAARDIAMVAAAGNNGPKAKPVFPSAYPGVIAVTAVDRSKRVYRRAGQGEHVDFAAPGVGVLTAASIRGSRVKTGTSFAAPFVTAAIGVMKSQEPDATSAAVEALSKGAEDLGDPGKDPVFGWGLLNARDLCLPAIRQ